MRDGPSHHPCWVLEFLLISVNLIGENAILLFYICIPLITSDVGHLFHMFMSHLHFFLWELSKWILKSPKQQTVKWKATQEASSAVLLPLSLSTCVLKCECWTGSSYYLLSSLFWLFSLQSSLSTTHVTLKPWSPSKHLLHQAAVMAKPEILERKWQM